MRLPPPRLSGPVTRSPYTTLCRSRVAPQGVVSFIESGWRRMPAFTPAACRIRFDLRLSPRTSAEEADRAVDMQLQTITARHGLDLSWRRLVTIPGTTTAPDNPTIPTTPQAGKEAECRPPHTP